ncbi:tRNA (adenosine(37)-N6)-threonylcarbamoyltransferase complex ATPase subunit type 1 TsaE [Sphingomonas sp.]|uniref:tRNA (adenosine(37)-N6)-threonylcarbamoyltransferase complex ATPase subunit type 1 TsaE n=1 Tax=Sphingomonas sp. TaxID=28214 RepID=UPI0025CCF843|nr:tRNA (adenosine(37)-N6)-threonylcarbamoyltransferase complex ATPase subunit type 1 TsaE [Sphingomonas sp.]
MFLADEAATKNVGRRLASVARAGDVIALSGQLGAGKTGLARGFVEALGFAGEVPSPSFGLVIPYDVPDVRLPVWHIDLYRLDDPSQVDELGLDDARMDTILLIEWPEQMGDRLWQDALRIDLAVDGTGRRLTAQVPPSWNERWPIR